MSAIEESSRTPTSPKRKENQRVVQFTVPESVFNRAKAQAYLSGVPWKTYLRTLLERAEQIGK